MLCIGGGGGEVGEWEWEAGEGEAGEGEGEEEEKGEEEGGDKIMYTLSIHSTSQLHGMSRVSSYLNKT